MKWYVYIIRSKLTGSYYTGSCCDISKRLDEHNSGKTRSTKSGRPWELVYCEDSDGRASAYRREKQIKSYKGGNAFKKLIK